MARSRSRSKHARPHRQLAVSTTATRRQLSNGVYIEKQVPAAQAVKSYVCPGCNTRIAPGQAHVVAWPEQAGLGEPVGIVARRHWHRHCWSIAR